jgi:hypothetical protein
MLTLRSFSRRIMTGRYCSCLSTSLLQEEIHFHCARGFNTQILAYMLDSLVRVSRRGEESHFVKIPIEQSYKNIRRLMALDSSSLAIGRHRGGSTTPPRSPALASDLDSRPRTMPLSYESRKMHKHGTGFLRFPFSNFRHSLTLFSKFFASFPHGTCSLSVSHRYLALDGIYHPL